MPPEELAAGLLAPRPETFVLKPGGRVQLSLAVLADGFADRLDRLPQSIDDLAQVRDAGTGWHDPLPTLYSALVSRWFKEFAVKVGVGHAYSYRCFDQAD